MVFSDDKWEGNIKASEEWVMARVGVGGCDF